MPNKFRAKVLQYVIYVQNRCSHAKLNEKTSQEVWSGQKPSVSHLKLFCSVAYGRVMAQQGINLEDMSKKLVLNGYDGDATNYSTS